MEKKMLNKNEINLKNNIWILHWILSALTDFVFQTIIVLKQLFNLGKFEKPINE